MGGVPPLHWMIPRTMENPLILKIGDKFGDQHLKTTENILKELRVNGFNEG